ncbi:MAG: hypothetical protein KatS3mg010_0939 [Acidimicrobiia bacterium]|nr:MAG: hypothetical protein KatS3mg010_0939 [Acidimicrobiia bacterium]
MIALNDEPVWRRPSVTTLYWSCSKSRPATMARTAPVALSRTTTPAVNGESPGITWLTAAAAIHWRRGSYVVSMRRPPRKTLS